MRKVAARTPDDSAFLVNPERLPPAPEVLTGLAMIPATVAACMAHE